MDPNFGPCTSHQKHKSVEEISTIPIPKWVFNTRYTERPKNGKKNQI